MLAAYSHVVHHHGAYGRRDTLWLNRCRKCVFFVNPRKRMVHCLLISAVSAIHFVKLARDLLHTCHILPLHGFLQAHLQNCTPLVRVLWMGRR